MRGISSNKRAKNHKSINPQIQSINPKKPIGSGCIAQVYQGTLKHPTTKLPKDTKVAIKVQHPGIWEKVCTDFYILAHFAKFLESLPYLQLEYLALQEKTAG